MKLLALVLVLVMLNPFVEGSLSQDLCKKSEHQLNCPASHAYLCKVDKCAVNKAACNGFNYFSYQLRISRNVASLQHNLVKYDQFLKSIQDCASEWQPNEICLNTAKCSLLEFNRSRNKYVRKLGNCNCMGEYSTECVNSKVCAMNNNACKAFTHETRFNKTLLEDIRSCLNGNNHEFLRVSI